MRRCKSIIQPSGMYIYDTTHLSSLGSDIAGEVLFVGFTVTKVKPRELVIACAENRHFQIFNTVKQSLAPILPDNATCTWGSFLPSTSCAAAVVPFQQDTLPLCLPRVRPTPDSNVTLAWGAWPALGMNSIEMLKAAGCTVAAVVGESNLGADYSFGHKSPTVRRTDLLSHWFAVIASHKTEISTYKVLWSV